MSETAAPSRLVGMAVRDQSRERSWVVWLPIVVGLVALYLPTYLSLAEAFVGTESGAQEPIFLLICLGLIWRKRALLQPVATQRGTVVYATLLLLLAALMYVLGRSQEFFQLEVGSQLPLCFAIVILMCGTAALRSLWFAIAFQIFLVPIPASFLGHVLLPLKQAVSDLVTNLLFLFGLPIAREGVVISIGPYQLLIANACSGLNSMIALTAIGMLYVHLNGRRDWRRNAWLLASVLPIAFGANILRVAGLVLATFLGGDTVGRYFHAIAAYIEIVAAFGAFFMVDTLIGRLTRRSPGSSPSAVS